MHRLFVALRPPPPMRAALLATVGGVPGARWQDDEQLHLTLRFVGEVDRHRTADLVAALSQVRSEPVTIRIEGTGAFDRRGRVYALWARVHADPVLLRLQVSVERAALRAGIGPELRAFRPHITLARLATERAAVEPWLVRTAGLSPAVAVVDSFILFESILGRNGAQYHAVELFPLDR